MINKDNIERMLGINLSCLALKDLVYYAHFVMLFLDFISVVTIRYRMWKCKVEWNLFVFINLL